MKGLKRVDDRSTNILSLCTGGGGLDLGVELAVPNARVVCGVEWEASACGYLAAAMEAGCLDPFPVWSDLRSFDGRPWRGVVDLVTAGYPCQPFSVAGKRRGADDPRHLWPHVARIILESDPAIVFLENVGGHLRLGFEQVGDELRAMGYRVAAGLFTAEEVGAPHRRERLFILADRCSVGSREGGWSTEDRGSEPDHDGGALADSGGTGLQGLDADWTPKSNLGHHGRGGRAELGHSNRDEQRRRNIHSRHLVAEAGTALPAWPPGPNDRDEWRRILEDRPDLAPAVEPQLCRVAYGLARAQRLRILGNGVVPLAAAHAFRTLAAELNIGKDP